MKDDDKEKIAVAPVSPAGVRVGLSAAGIASASATLGGIVGSIAGYIKGNIANGNVITWLGFLTAVIISAVGLYTIFTYLF